MATPGAEDPILPGQLSTAALFIAVPVALVEVAWWHAGGLVFAAALSLTWVALLRPSLLAVAFVRLLGPPNIRTSNGGVAVLMRMRQHPTSLRVQLQGAAAVAVVTSRKDASQEAKEQLVKLGVFKVLGAALEQHPDQLELATRVFVAVSHLASLPAAKDWVLEQGGQAIMPFVTSMTRALEMDKQVAESLQEGEDGETAAAPTASAQQVANVTKTACIALGALVDDRPKLQTMIVDEGFAEACLAAVEWFQLHGPVNQWVLWALFNTCYEHKSNKVYLVKRDGLRIIVEAMKRHPSLLEVQRHGVALLFYLLRPEEGVDVKRLHEVGKAAGIEAVLDAAMDTHKDCTEIREMGRALVRGTFGR